MLEKSIWDVAEALMREQKDGIAQLPDHPNQVFKLNSIIYLLDDKPLFDKGDGAEGIIYRAQNRQGEKFILKIQDSSKEAEIIAMKEFKQLTGLIRINNSDYLLMPDYGMRLNDFLSSRNVSIRDRMQMTLELKDFLNDIHGRRFSHGDIKAKNIVVDQRPVIVDFGNAKMNPTPDLIQKDCRDLASVILQELDMRPHQAKLALGRKIAGITNSADLDGFVASIFPGAQHAPNGPPSSYSAMVQTKYKTLGDNPKIPGGQSIAPSQKPDNQNVNGVAVARETKKTLGDQPAAFRDISQEPDTVASREQRDRLSGLLHSTAASRSAKTPANDPVLPNDTILKELEQIISGDKSIGVRFHAQKEKDRQGIIAQVKSELINKLQSLKIPLDQKIEIVNFLIKKTHNNEINFPRRTDNIAYLAINFLRDPKSAPETKADTIKILTEIHNDMQELKREKDNKIR